MIYLWTELVCGNIKHKSKFCSQVIYTICITVYFEILLEYTVVWDWKFTFHQSEIQMKSNYKSDEILNTKWCCEENGKFFQRFLRLAIQNNENAFL